MGDTSKYLGLSEIDRYFFKYPWDTKRGVINISIGMFILLGIAYKIFYEFFNIFFIIWLNVLFIYYIIWLVRRLNYNYLSDKLFVIFAVTIDNEDKKLKKEYEALINNFSEKLKDYNLSNKIKVKTKPVDIKFSDNSAAEAKTHINMLCSTLIISGLPIISSNEIEFKLNFSYEFIYPGNKCNEEYYKKILNENVKRALVNRDWKIGDNIKSKKSLYLNTFNVCTFILSLCMVTSDRSDEAVKLLEPIRDECNRNINKKEYGPLIREIREYLFLISKIKFNINYWSLDLNILKPIVDEMERLSNSSYETYMSKAIIKELEGDRKEARELTQRAEYSHPKNAYEFKFNYLYFNLMEDKFNEAINNLNEMIGLIKVIDIGPIINFLYYQLEKTNNPTLLFNIGVILYIWGEKELGKKELEQFICRCKDNENFKILIEKTKLLLKIYNNIALRGI